MTQDEGAKHLAPDEGSQYLLITDYYTIKATGADTGGAYSLLCAVVAPGSGPPPHIHRREDEAFTVLEGEFEFLAGDRVVRTGPGDFVFGPRNIAHTFKNVGSEPGRLLIICSPPGFEQFVAEAGVEITETGVQADESPDVARIMEIAARYGIEILPPPV